MAKVFTVRFLSGIHWFKSTSKMTEEAARVRFFHTKWELLPETEEERMSVMGPVPESRPNRIGEIASQR